jgi:hypothetical protein
MKESHSPGVTGMCLYNPLYTSTDSALALIGTKIESSP